MIIDVYYWFDKSTKRKAELADFIPFVMLLTGMLSNMLIQDG